MFTKKTKNSTSNNHETNKETNPNSLYSWVTGKVGSFILFSGVGYAIYKFGILNQLSNYFSKSKEKNPTH